MTKIHGRDEPLLRHRRTVEMTLRTGVKVKVEVYEPHEYHSSRIAKGGVLRSPRLVNEYTPLWRYLSDD